VAARRAVIFTSPYSSFATLNGVAVAENAGAGGCSTCGASDAEVGGAGLVVIERLDRGRHHTTVIATDRFVFTGSVQT
jgi:hypothetical protein